VRSWIKSPIDQQAKLIYFTLEKYAMQILHNTSMWVFNSQLVVNYK